MPARVLVVCTANICRSPVIASLLSARLGPSVEVESRGTRSLEGAGICDVSAAWALTHGIGSLDHKSRSLELADIKASTVIFTATRQHRSRVLELRPSAQVRTFTLLQAARIATWLAEQGVSPPAAEVSDRLLWLTEELDASRGSALLPALDEEDDLPDPHSGADHSVIYERIVVGVSAITSALEPAPA